MIDVLFNLFNLILKPEPAREKMRILYYGAIITLSVLLIVSVITLTLR